jgi:hypothetical protein
MHNAAAFGGLYSAPRLKMNAEGYVRVEHAAPDWTLVWLKMIEAAPQLPQGERQ